MALPWTKRILAGLVVVGSWLYFINLLPIKGEIYYPDPFRWFADFLLGPITLLVFGLLRASVIRSAALPDEYLDEREIANRDWAYRLGYLVVRRLGLGLVIAILAFMLAMNIWADPSLGGEWKGPDMSADGFQYLRSVANYIKVFFATSALEHLLTLLALLTFTAYSFPVILLAWKDSNQYEPQDDKNDWQSIELISKLYFRKLKQIGLGLVLFLAILAISSKWAWNVFFALLFYAVYVFSWSMAKQLEVLFMVKSSERKNRFKDLLQLSVAVSLLGASIPTSMLWAMANQNTSWILFYALGAGFLVLLLQATSFAIAADEAKK